MRSFVIAALLGAVTANTNADDTTGIFGTIALLLVFECDLTSHRYLPAGLPPPLFASGSMTVVGACAGCAG